ncbi:hypothetical protein OQA88_8705 [Cercophora sp. LCS_1]
MPLFFHDRVGLATYHLPPNFSIHPPPSGPIELGSILNNLQDVEVINPDSRVEISKASIYCHQKHGFTATRSRMRKGEFGVWAKMVGMDGVGGELSASRGFSEETEYNFNRLDTFTFTPSAEYLAASMRELEVSEYVQATDWEPVYLVTGIKVAVGPSIRLTRTASTAGKVEMGLHQTASFPVEMGTRVEFEREGHVSEGWETSDDFIFGLRLKKLVYKRGWLARWRGEERQLRASQFNKGAQLVGIDDDDDESDEDEVMELEVLEGENAEVEDDGVEETRWIVAESDPRQ